MEDLIRRSDAIDLVYKARKADPINGTFTDTMSWAIAAVQAIPAVEPCKDAISREWMLNELEEMNVANFYEANFHSNEVYGDMKQMIKDAPPVTVEPKQGEWIITEQDNGNKWWTHRKCSECGGGVIKPPGVSAMKFCPNCGAKMKGADDE